MSDYFIQEETMNILANHARRISGSSDKLSCTDILDIMSRIQNPTTKTTGKYLVETIIDKSTTGKSGMYDTGEIFALIKDDTDDLQVYAYQPSSGTEVLTTIATFDGWVSTSPIINDYIIVEDKPIWIGKLYRPVDDALVLCLHNWAGHRTCNCSVISESPFTIDWGDGTIEHFDKTASSTIYIDHVYKVDNVHYIIKIKKDDLNLNKSLQFKITSSVYITHISYPSDNNIWFTGFDRECIEHIYYAKGYSGSVQDISGMYNLKSISFPPTVSSYGCYNINKWNSPSIKYIIPYGITTVDDFYQSNLTEIIIPDSATSINQGAFNYCSKLQNVHLSKNITNIPPNCFANCPSLSSINIPDSVTSISNYAFEYSGNGALTIILRKVTSIGAKALYMTGLTLIILTDSICTLGKNGITSGTVVYVPDNLLNSYKSATNWSEFASNIKPLSECTIEY